jgi:hypothetical protein
MQHAERTRHVGESEQHAHHEKRNHQESARDREVRHRTRARIADQRTIHARSPRDRIPKKQRAGGEARNRTREQFPHAEPERKGDPHGHEAKYAIDHDSCSLALDARTITDEIQGLLPQAAPIVIVSKCHRTGKSSQARSRGAAREAPTKVARRKQNGTTNTLVPVKAMP